MTTQANRLGCTCPLNAVSPTDATATIATDVATDPVSISPAHIVAAASAPPPSLTTTDQTILTYFAHYITPFIGLSTSMPYDFLPADYAISKLSRHVVTVDVVVLFKRELDCNLAHEHEVGMRSQICAGSMGDAEPSQLKSDAQSDDRVEGEIPYSADPSTSHRLHSR